MTALTTILEQVKTERIRLEPRAGKLRVIAAPGKTVPEALKAELKAHKTELLDAIQTQNLKAAITRLECGEADAIRCYSRTCGGQFLVLRDDHIPESIEIDCPSFTLEELQELLGASPDHIKHVYQLKEVLTGTTIESSAGEQKQDQRIEEGSE